MTSSSPTPGLSAPATRDTPWTNWAGTVSATPAYTVAARHENDVAEAVRFAIEQKFPVRVIGTGHSWTGLGATEGVLIDVSQLSGLRVVDRDRKRVAIAAGTSIFQACEALWEEGFSLKNQGDIDVQTVAGAASTGTHGSGITLGNIASSIRRVRLVDGRGEIVEITEEDPDLLRAARVSLGTLGIFVEIELEVTDRYFLEEEVRFPSWDELAAKWEGNVRENLHHSFIWFPNQSSLDLLAPMEFPQGAEVPDHAEHRQINVVDGPARTIDEATRVDRNYLIYHGTFTGPYYEFEHFVAAEDALEVMTRLRQLALSDDGPYSMQPRWIKGDDAFLSPCFGRDSVGISICGDVSQKTLDFMHKVDAVFAEYEGRPHWGKIHFFDNARVKEVFPEFDKFNQSRQQFDPNNIFANELTRQLFGA